MNNEILVKDGITLFDIASNPNNYPSELKTYSLETIKLLKSQLRDIEIAISSNVINEMILENATKLLFVGMDGQEKTLTLKSGTKKLNTSIKNYEDYLITSGFPNLLETKVVPLQWSACKEIRKQGNEIQRVIDHLYVDSDNKIEIK